MAWVVEGSAATVFACLVVPVDGTTQRTVELCHVRLPRPPSLRSTKKAIDWDENGNWVGDTVTVPSTPQYERHQDARGGRSDEVIHVNLGRGVCISEGDHVSKGHDRRKLHWVSGIGLVLCLVAVVSACNLLAGIGAPTEREQPDVGLPAFQDSASDASPTDGGDWEDEDGAGAAGADGNEARGGDALGLEMDLDADGEGVHDCHSNEATAYDAIGDAPVGDMSAPASGRDSASPADRECNLDAGYDATDEMVTLHLLLSGPRDAIVRVTNAEGEVLASPCEPGACSIRATKGSRVTLTASLSQGTAITTWDECESSDKNVCNITVRDDKSVSVTVQRGYTLAITNSGTGTGNVSFSPANGTDSCTVPCSVVVPEGSVAISAMAAVGSEFSRWDDNTTACTRILEMNADREVDVQFLWTPAALSTLKLWLDASASVGVNPSGKVEYWNDRSPNRANFRQDVPEHRPDFWNGMLNGHACLRFDGAQVLRHESAALDAGNSDFIVSVIASSQGLEGRSGTIWHQMDLANTLYPDQMAILLNRSDRNDLDTPTASAFVNGCWKASGHLYCDAVGSQYGDGSPHLFTMRHVSFSESLDNGFSGNVSLRLDGREKAKELSRGFCSRTGMTTLGARITQVGGESCTPGFTDYLVGDIAEVVYIIGATSDQDLTRIENYLLAKYGLPAP